jgi:TRAP-type uncharacterized transport system substrate-binding protein
MAAILRTLPILLLGLLLLSGLASGVTYVLRKLDLYPPERLSIAAGAPGSAYYESARRYRAILARDDIELEIRETAGSVANAAALADPEGVDIALIQGGVPLPEDVVGLAAVRVEPLWIISRTDLPDDPHDWGDLRISAGAEGSGTRLIADNLARITGAEKLTGDRALALGGGAAAEALQAGRVDAALFVAPVEASYLQSLLSSDAYQLRSLAHSEAIALRLPGAQLVRLPSGILDYDRPLPAEDLELIALATRLVARNDLHPALVNRLIHAVLEVHRGGEILPADRRYPATSSLGVPADAYAAQLLDKGFSPLENFLPYWIVAQLNRVLLVLVPALILLLPLMRMLPALYGAILDRRVYRHYARVHEIDETLVNEGSAMPEEGLRALRDELDTIERKLLRANLPNSYRKQAYTLLHHLDYVRKRGDDILMQRSQS